MRSRIFEAATDTNKAKFYMLFAYPTVSGAPHVGHARSYTIPDAIARFKRMQGFNVFFPLGFHATGIDCITIFEKVKEDPKYGRRYGIHIEDAEKLKSPIDVEKYLERIMVKTFQRLGLSLDYQPKVSTIDPPYGRFIQWQFRKLYDTGYLVQKDHRLPWCPQCDHPVSLDAAEADISEWKGTTIKECTVIKFRDANGIIFPASTLRPETIYGVTNLWLNPKAVYVKAKVNKEVWITSKASCKKLREQGKTVKILEELSGISLGTKVINPITNVIVPILMADFVNPEEATGVVMSVLAHDPFDYIHIKSAYAQIEPIQVIEVDGMGKIPAKDVVEEFRITNTDDPRLEEAVKELYKRENRGRIVSTIQKFGKMRTIEAREAIREYLETHHESDRVYELSVKPIYCRCGAEITVKVIKGQWFINYADPNWKNKAKQCIEKIVTYPPDYKEQLPEIVEWLAERPCVRRRGLGTSFPFENGWTIEALSDSTIYMTIFIVTKYLNAGMIHEDQLTDSFFDYVFLNKGATNEVAKETAIPEELLRKVREEFDYWYPLDLNAGGKEHKSVHFPFFILNHVAIFPERYWPKGIFVNWHLVTYGQKMSKHLGNVVFLDDAINKWGADTIRFYLLHGSNQWQDFDWRGEECDTYQRHLERFQNMIQEVTKHIENTNSLSVMDNWLRSTFNMKIQDVTNALEKGEIRKAIDAAFFGVWNDIAWYRRRTGNAGIAEKYIKSWLKLLASFIPHLCEEIWHMLGEKTFITLAVWPKAKREYVDMKVIRLEDILQKTMGDMKHILELTGCKKKACIYTASEEEYEHFTMATEFLERALNIDEVSVFGAEDPKRYDPENRARRAKAGRPGIYLE